MSLFSVYRSVYERTKAFLAAHPHIDRATRVLRRALRNLLIPPKVMEEQIPNPFQWDDMLLHYRSSDQGDLHIMFSLMAGGYEPETTEIIRSILQPGSTMVDIGAHIGLYSLVAARLIGPTGKVFAFEADPDTTALLQRNVHVNDFADRIQIIPMAVYSTSGSITIHKLRGHSTSTSIQNTPDDAGEAIVVKMTSLDDFFSHMEWPRVDLIKMDVEGAEIHALEGMAELLKRNPQMKLITELNLNRILQAGHSLDDMITAVQDSGFHSIRVLHPGWDKVNIRADREKLFKLVQDYNVNILCER